MLRLIQWVLRLKFLLSIYFFICVVLSPSWMKGHCRPLSCCQQLSHVPCFQYDIHCANMAQDYYLVQPQFVYNELEWSKIKMAIIKVYCAQTQTCIVGCHVKIYILPSWKWFSIISNTLKIWCLLTNHFFFFSFYIIKK